MKRVVFVRDKTNKHSIRALLEDNKKWFPEKDYYVLTPQDAFEFLKEDDLALFSFLTGTSSAYIDYVTKLKEKQPKINTVCGGAHPSARSEDMLEYFDGVCAGEGEESIKDIIEIPSKPYFRISSIAAVLRHHEIFLISDNSITSVAVLFMKLIP